MNTQDWPDNPGDAVAIAQAIDNLPWDEEKVVDDALAANIIACFPAGPRGYDLFAFLDEKPAHWLLEDMSGYRTPGQWTVKLRQVRNNPGWDLFGRFK